MSDRMPAEVFSLAEHIYDEMVARGWKASDLAMRMGSSLTEVSMDYLVLSVILCVQKDNMLIGDETFSKLAKAFGVSREFLENIDSAWRRADPNRRAAFTPPDEIFDVRLR